MASCAVINILLLNRDQSCFPGEIFKLRPYGIDNGIHVSKSLIELIFFAFHDIYIHIMKIDQMGISSVN